MKCQCRKCYRGDGHSVMRMEKVPTNPPGGAVEFHRCHLSLDVEQDKSIQRVQKKKKKVFAEEGRYVGE